tara:strand:- start:5216 stop:5929 length:714 start_codon:yes stop_codon:yes gene_type:complete
MKKAAMFGLLRALKKQSGRLFLARRHSADSKETRGSFKTTRAAMFGLDARIALAIFGALSVISGAALYSAIQQSKVISIITDMNEIGKAWEAYYLDTGTSLAQTDSSDNSDIDFYRLKIRDLITDPSVNNWQGPYINREYTTDYSLKYPSGFLTAITLTDDKVWGGTTSWSPAGYCQSGDSCHLYIFLEDSNNLASKIDDYVDGGDGLQTGNFRAWTPNASSHRYFLKYAPIANPND